MNSNELPFNERDFSRLNLDDIAAVLQSFEEEGVPESETCPILPTWDSSPWMPHASYQISEREAPSLAGVGNFGSQEPAHSTNDALVSTESLAGPFPFQAGFDLSDGIVHCDANKRFPSPGELLPAEQHQNILHLGTHLRCN